MKCFIAFVVCMTCCLWGYAQYHNPVLDADFPDPTVIKAQDGLFYAYATQTKTNGKWVNIQVATSPDGHTWKLLGDALPVKPAWAAHTQDFWAPHVLYDSAMGKYVMFYSAESDDTATTKCIGIALSSTPQGPFVPEDTPLVSGKGFVNIDPMAFVDPISHKKLLYWGSGFRPIKVQEMADNWRNFAPGSQPKDVVPPKKDKNYSNLVEGAWVDYNNGKYYLYYSGDNCCANPKYAVMVARADNPFGPFIRLSEATGSAESAILEKDSTWLAPGHNSLFRDNKGDLYIAYHAVWQSEVKARAPFRRVMLIKRVVYKNGWPVVLDDINSR